MIEKRYSDLIKIPDYLGRFNYLKLCDKCIGEETFGWRRYLNQKFYASQEWKNFRRRIILRDTIRSYCCDLAHKDYPIQGSIYIHHINPIKPEDLYSGADWIWDPEYLICVSYDTHAKIHYGGEIIEILPERKPGDTKLW